MTDSPSSNVNYRIAVGYPLSYRLEQALKSSALWKEAEIVRSIDPKHLQPLSYQGRAYIGKLSPKDFLSVEDCRQLAQEILNKLLEYQPKLSLQIGEIVLFPYVLVG